LEKSGGGGFVGLWLFYRVFLRKVGVWCGAFVVNLWTSVWLTWTKIRRFSVAEK
jgi:hypothetical protein